MTSDRLIAALGHAVGAIWGDLLTIVQHDLFEAAVRSAGEDARENLAIFLQVQHPPTTDSGRDRVSLSLTALVASGVKTRSVCGTILAPLKYWLGHAVV